MNSENKVSEIAETLRKIKDLARWDGPDAAPKRMHEIWQIVSTAIENREWERAIAESQVPQPKVRVHLDCPKCGYYFEGWENPPTVCPNDGTKLELGDGEPSPPAASLDSLMGEFCETRAISRTGTKEALSFAQFVRQRDADSAMIAAQLPGPEYRCASCGEFLEIGPQDETVIHFKVCKCRSGAAQEVSPPSPEPRETDGHPVGWCCKHCYDGGYQAAMRLLAEGEKMNDGQIRHMVNRFLGWRLPGNFNPDGGISFKRTFNEHTAHPMKHEPVGTNLLDYTQAEAMIRYLVEGL